MQLAGSCMAIRNDIPSAWRGVVTQQMKVNESR
jgi:hypothetical protein